VSLKKIFLKTKLTYKIYLYYNLYIRHKAHKKRDYYSQWGEDTFIKEYFKKKEKGFYVDIGSFHPIMYSNTCGLFDIGWSGINIDLNQTSIDLFKIIRPRDHNICAAISSKSEKKDVYFDDHFSPVNTISKSFYEASNKNISFKNLVKKQIMTMTFSDIVKQISDIPKINFLNIDCEGHDYSILNSINLEFYNPDLICIETHDVNDKEVLDSKNIFSLLEKNNYKVIERCGPSSIFVNNKN